MSLLSYSGLATKLRAMSSKLLTDEDFRRIAEMSSVSDAATFLKSKPTYAPYFAGPDEQHLHRGDIERTLSGSVYDDLKKIYRFADDKQRQCLLTYTQMYEVDFLKCCLDDIFDQRNVEISTPAMRELLMKHSCLDINRLTAVTTPDEFLAALTDTPYHDAFVRLVKADAPTLFDYEMALDIYHFTSLWKGKDTIAAGDDLTQLTKIYGSKFDLLNIQWIKRAKKYYHLPAAKIYSFLIPVHYKLKKEDIKALTEAEDMAALQAAIKATYYGTHFNELTLETLEITYISIMKAILQRAAKNHPYSLAIIYYYFYQKRHEVSRLIIALECVRYGIEPDVTMKRIAIN